VALQAVILVPLANYGTSHHYLATLQDKVQLLKDTPSPRIIFLGGSNLAFGLDSPQIAAKTDYHPVNLGLHVSYGLDPQFQMLKKHLRSDDLVVLCPEYGMFETGFGCKIEIAVETYDIWAESLEFLQPSIEQPLQPLGRSPLRRFADLVANGRREFADSLNKSAGIYDRRGFNEYGDHIAHHKASSKSANKTLNKPRIPSQKDVSQAAVELNSFIALCESKGASVVFPHPPLVTENLTSQSAEALVFDQALRQHLSCPVITSIDEITLETEFFFDTNYHLTQAGGEYRTAAICEGLRKHQQRQAAASENKTR